MSGENKVSIVTCENNKILSGKVSLEFAKEEAKKHFQNNNETIVIIGEDICTSVRIVLSKRENGVWSDF